MSFQEKSAIAMVASLTIVYGVYFAIVLRLWVENPAVDAFVYQPAMIVATILPLVFLAVLSHIVIAVTNPKDAGASDERDHLVALRSEGIAGYILAVGVFAGVVLAMLQSPHFFIANALLLAWVVAEITEGMTKIALYRSGA